MTTALLILAETVAGTGLIGLLIYLLILSVVIYVVWLIMNMLPIPEPIKTIVLCILGLVLLLVIVSRLGFI
jgi:hypothetical protein